jgi:hypothetical protein
VSEFKSHGLIPEKKEKMNNLKLNLTEKEARSPHIGARSSQEILYYRADWLAMHAELKVRAELIEKLDVKIIRCQEAHDKHIRELRTLRASINAAYDEMITDVNCGELLEEGKNIDGLYHAIEIMRKHGLMPEKILGMEVKLDAALNEDEFRLQPK